MPPPSRTCFLLPILVMFVFLTFIRDGFSQSSSSRRNIGGEGQVSNAGVVPRATAANDTRWLSVDEGWFITGLLGPITTDFTSDIAKLNFDVDDTYMASLEIGKRIFKWRDLVSIELQSQIGRHFGRQSHFEFTWAGIVRWEKFPWDHIVDTSIAAGTGISLATGTPSRERERHEALEGAQPLLHYVLLELAFAIPSEEEWSLVTRYHHRSGAFGTYGAKEASTGFLIGLRYRFGR